MKEQTEADVETIKLVIDDLRANFSRCEKCVQSLAPADLEGRYREDYNRLLTETEEQATAIARWLIVGAWTYPDHWTADDARSTQSDAAERAPALIIMDGQKFTAKFSRELIRLGDWPSFVAELATVHEAVCNAGAWRGLQPDPSAEAAMKYMSKI